LAKNMARRRGNPKWPAAIAALLSEPTVEKAAKKIKVGYSTLKLWTKNPEFKRQFREARQALVEGTVVRLNQLSLGAVLALGRNLICGKEAVEVRAANAILEHTQRFAQIDLAQEIAELREQIEELRSGNISTGGPETDRRRAGVGSGASQGSDSAASNPERSADGISGTDPGSASEGPCPVDDPGQDDARRLAKKTAPLDISTDTPALFTPGREIPDRGGHGTASRSA
jgi:hypothetical protein